MNKGLAVQLNASVAQSAHDDVTSLFWHGLASTEDYNLMVDAGCGFTCSAKLLLEQCSHHTNRLGRNAKGETDLKNKDAFFFFFSPR